MIQIELELVDRMPAEVNPGKLYVSLNYRTSTHLCSCGCGSRVVLKLGPKHWRIILNGETVSMHPSVGNWQLPCRSHYWNRDGKFIEAERWSDKEFLRMRKESRGQFSGWPGWLNDGDSCDSDGHTKEY